MAFTILLMTDFRFLQTEEYNNFIIENENADTLRLRLKSHSGNKFDIKFAIMQIECRQKTKQKLPTLYNKLTFPTNLSIEQCTSEVLAEFHAKLFSGCDSVADLTCGLGIDSYHISKYCNSLTSVELNTTVSEVADYNFRNLGCQNIHVENCDAETFTKNLTHHISGVFIDPSRRVDDDSNKRVYKISDCSPNLRTVISNLKDKADFIIIKASPMVDITQTLRDFENITHIWILSVKNECKELLFRIDFTDDNKSKKIPIDTLNFEKGTVQTHTLIWGNDYRANIPELSPELSVGNLLYVPNSSIMKSGIPESLCGNFDIRQIAINSHLYIGTDYICEFPGKVYKINDILTLSKEDIRKLRTNIKNANIACRNFPLKPDELRKKLKIKDGGENYIFATKLNGNRNVLIICKKYS